MSRNTVGGAVTVVVMLLVSGVLSSDAFTEEPEQKVRAQLFGGRYWNYLYCEGSYSEGFREDDVDREIDSLSQMDGAFLVNASDPTQPAALGIAIWTEGSGSIQVCTETHNFWDFVSFEAARLVRIKESEAGEDETVFKDLQLPVEDVAEDFVYRIQPVANTTFRYELVQKVFVGTPSEVLPCFSAHGKEITLPHGSVWLGEHLLQVLYYVYPEGSSFEEGPYIFRAKIDYEQMKQFLPDLAAALETVEKEDYPSLGEWCNTYIHLFRTLNEPKKLNSYFSAFTMLAQGEASINWLKNIAEGEYPNRAFLWYGLGEACQYIGNYDQALVYYKKCYDMIAASQDNLITRPANARLSCANTIAMCYERKGDYDSALYWCQIAFDELRSPDITGIGGSPINEGCLEEMRIFIQDIIRTISEKTK